MNNNYLIKLIISAAIVFFSTSCEKESIESTQTEAALTEFNAVATKTVTVTDRNPETFAKSLVNAVKSAGWNGTVQLGEGTFTSNYIIILPKDVKTTIIGAGKTKTYIKLSKNPGPTAGFLILNANETSVKNLTVDAQYNMQYGACAVNTNGFSDIFLEKVGFSNASIGTGTPDNGSGQNIAGLIIQNCSFWNCEHGINFNRQYSVNRIPWVKKPIIRWNWFGGKQDAAISIDCGNDGTDGVISRRNLPGAKEATQTVTNMDGMLIAGNTIKKCKKYNIAIAKAWNIVIKNNTLHGNTGEIEYGECINLEHETYGVTIENNRIYNDNLKNKNFSYISLLTFRDYGNKPLLENGCRRIKIRNNTFRGDCNYGITGEYAQEITINNNDFSNPRPAVRGINFYVKSSKIWHWSNGIDNLASIVN